MLRVLAGRFGGGLAAVTAVIGLLFATVPSAEAARQKRTAVKPQAKAQVAALATAPVSIAKPAVTTVAPVSAAAPPVAVVSLNQQTVTIYSGTNVIARSPISSGMTGYRTPTGVFSIIQKARYHESNLYENAPMPFMQRLTWSGIAFHGGRIPGYPASHGCVRLPQDFAERAFGLLKMGSRVIVASEAIVPEPIVHAALPKPLFTPVTLMASAPGSAGPLQLASYGANGMMERLLNPVQTAELEKRRTQAALLEAKAEVRLLLDIAADSASRADAARLARLQLERDIAGFRDLLTSVEQRRATAADEEARGQAVATIAALEDGISDATAALVAARDEEVAISDLSFADARRARDAEDVAERADEAARVASRGTEPLTVFISRAEGRVQVRQGFHTLLEGDFSLRDPDQPLGTHVMTAGPLLDPYSGMRWTSVSMADGPVKGISASDALDRITLEPKLADEIGRRLWTGATVLISDQPASRETGRGTDFVILTK